LAAIALSGAEMAWDDPYDSGLITSIDPRISSNPYMDEAAGLRIQNQYLEQQRRQRQQPQDGRQQSGKGSWYSQYPEAGWVDREDRPGSNALGVPDSQQGIALPSRSTLGQWFDVTAPNGETYRLQQTDVGPAKWTGKGIDIAAAAAHKMGYTPKDFPTGGGFTWKPASGPPPENDYDSVASSPYGRRRMDDTQQQPPGLLQSLFGGGRPQSLDGRPQGLLGALDPEKMAYLAMIAKGLSPYSTLDPEGMLKLAQTKRESEADRLLRQQQLAISQGHLDISQTQERRNQAEYDTKQAREEAARRGALELFGAPGVPASPDGTGSPAQPDGTGSPAQTAMTRENINNYFRKFPEAQDSPTGKMLLRHLEKLDAQEEARTKLPREIADRTKIADEAGLQGAQRQEYIYGLKEQDKSIPAGESGRLALADIYLKRAPRIAEEIKKGNLTGPYDVAMGKQGVGQQGMVMGDIKSGVDALRRMLTGQGMPASEAAEYIQRYEPTYKDTVTTLKHKHERLVEELTGMRDNIMRGRGSTPAPSQTGGKQSPNAAPMEGARQAKDGNWYVQRNGQYFRVDQ
jgi:hypothetical protein